MTLDEAIKHAEEVADKLELEAECIRNWGKESDPKRGAINCDKCATDHRQLADWLKDYKRLLDQEQKTVRCKDCRWWKDSDGVYRRGVGAESQCPINCREVQEGNGYCFRYKPQEREEEE